MNPHREAVVIGGGLAGAIVALDLATAGQRVTLLERSHAAHDKVCGEFLSREALHYLARCGIDPVELGAVSIRRVRLVTRHGAWTVDLPFCALSLSRKRLDEAMLCQAAAAGVEVRRDAYVEGLQQIGPRWSIDVRAAAPVPADAVFLATGKHDLRGLPRPAGTHAGLIAFKMYYQLTPQQQASLGDSVELILFPGGYAGLQPVEGGRANLCLLVTAKQLRACGSSPAALWQHLLQTSGHLAERLQDATPLLATPLALSHIPYGHVQMPVQDGLWRVGDQAAVIPSFCGDGMAIALHSGALAARDFLCDRSPADFQRTVRAQMRGRLRLATGLSRLLVSFPQAAQLVRFYPAMLSAIALMTRIPDADLLPAAPLDA